VANVEVLKGKRQEAISTLEELKTALAKAERDLSFTVIRAPHRRRGRTIAPCKPVIMCRPASDSRALCRSKTFTSAANFKEKQVGALAAGTVGLDRRSIALPEHAIEGVVESFSPASGASVLAAAAGQRDRQLHQNHAAAAGAHPGAARGRTRRIAAPRHVGGGERGHQEQRARRELQAATNAERFGALIRNEDRPKEKRQMANAATITAGTAAPVRGAGSPPAISERVDPARVVAFVAMCFGMFMAFLDIQVVSASLSEIQAGLAASADEVTWVQTSYLMRKWSRFRFPAFSRARSARASCSPARRPASRSRAVPLQHL